MSWTTYSFIIIVAVLNILLLVAASEKGEWVQVLNFERDVTDISSRDVIEMMMITQYFDMLKDIGVAKGSSTVFMPHSPATVADVASQIRAGFMQAQAGSAGLHPAQSPMNVGMQR